MMYKLVFQPKGFVCNPHGNQLVFKIRPYAASLEEINTALKRISTPYKLAINIEHGGPRGYVLGIRTTATAMTQDEINELLAELNHHLKRLKRGERTSTNSIVDLTDLRLPESKDSNNKPPKPVFVNRPRF